MSPPLVPAAVDDQRLARRIEWLDRLGVELPESVAGDRQPWHAVVSSRLGRTPLAHHVELATIYRWIEQAIAANHRPLTVTSTAADRWVTRSCQLLGIQPLRLDLDADRPAGSAATACPAVVRVAGRQTAATRDEVAVMIADRVDAAMVRRGGTIHRLLLQRLAHDDSASVRVLVPVQPWGQPVAAGTSRVIQELIDAGAVGYCCHWETPDDRDAAAERSGPLAAGEVVSTGDHNPASQPSAASRELAAARLLRQSDQWLVHCTRARQAAWPGQSNDQFLDGLLLSTPQPFDPSPLPTLRRIVTQQQLVGSGRTMRSGKPVVCFSDKPILEVVGQRAFRSHLGRWDGEPFGIAVRKSVAMQRGARPVIYYDPAQQPPPSPADHLGDRDDWQWRLQPVGKSYDWTTQREWRLQGALDLRQFSADDAVVFVAADQQCHQLADSKWPVVSIESLQRSDRDRAAT